MSTIYTVGDGKRTQCAMRADGVWFVRTWWHRSWGKWTEFGTQRPFAFDMYKAPRCSSALLPVKRSNDEEPKEG